uniref:Uncharacterized protein n=1 Tax=virus sp. ctrcb4 TaxID=2825824 RepID=A0A8S5RPX7_9VIRU|nr:MAG TPA: hypothetical protein [virus sp. ctrcb4]DAR12661.1 MAG TPA: hypothetical protein [Crassvirales sp.]
MTELYLMVQEISYMLSLEILRLMNCLLIHL